MKKIYAWAGGIALLALFFTAHHYMPSRREDSDRYYHFALSREMSQSGKLWLREVPQVYGLGWDRYFPDKEFLFHQLTARAYGLGGPSAVSAAVAVAAALSLLVAYLYALGALPPFLAVLSVALAYFWPTLLFRLFLVRPHVLAVLAFTILNAGLLRGRRGVALGGALLYALSYHAFYLPLASIFLFAASALGAAANERRARLGLAGFAFLGLLAGTLVNPYFPSNVVNGLEMASVTHLMQTTLAGVSFGKELLPLQADDFFRLFLWPILLVPFFATRVSAAWAARRPWRNEAYLLANGVLFLGLAFFSRRAVEYLLPICFFALVSLLREPPRWSRAGRLALATGVAVFAAFCFRAYLTQARLPSEHRGEITRAALPAIPENPAHRTRVFNCEWDLSPYLFYYRPDLAFTDILDPSFLYFYDPTAFFLKEGFRRGTVTDVHRVVREKFGADYVLCRDPGMQDAMMHDPAFTLLYPKEGARLSDMLFVPAVFRVAAEPPPQYVRAFQPRLALAAAKAEASSITPRTPAVELAPLELAHTTAVDFKSVDVSPAGDRSTLLAGGERCAWMVPTPGEIRRLAGANYAALGGGPNLRLWRNGQPLFASAMPYARARSSQVVVPLRPALAPQDRLELLVCATEGAGFWEGSISLWKEGEFAALCSAARGGAARSAAKFPLEGARPDSCLGPFALPPAPPSLERIQFSN